APGPRPASWPATATPEPGVDAPRSGENNVRGVRRLRAPCARFHGAVRDVSPPSGVPGDGQDDAAGNVGGRGPGPRRPGPRHRAATGGEPTRSGTPWMARRPEPWDGLGGAGASGSRGSGAYGGGGGSGAYGGGERGSGAYGGRGAGAGAGAYG